MFLKTPQVQQSYRNQKSEMNLGYFLLAPEIWAHGKLKESSHIKETPNKCIWFAERHDFFYFLDAPKEYQGSGWAAEHTFWSYWMPCLRALKYSQTVKRGLNNGISSLRSWPPASCIVLGYYFGEAHTNVIGKQEQVCVPECLITALHLKSVSPVK